MFAETIKVGSHTMIVLADMSSNHVLSSSPPEVTVHKVISMFEAGMLIQSLAVILTENGNDVGDLIRRVLER